MERLFFIYMPGCATCAAVKPVVAEFDRTHSNVRVLGVDITAVRWDARKWMPEVTPTLVKLDRRGKYHVFDGRPADDGEGRVITPDEVKTWLAANF